MEIEAGGVQYKLGEIIRVGNYCLEFNLKTHIIIFLIAKLKPKLSLAVFLISPKYSLHNIAA